MLRRLSSKNKREKERTFNRTLLQFTLTPKNLTKQIKKKIKEARQNPPKHNTKRKY